jgi:hypothetical protein
MTRVLLISSILCLILCCKKTNTNTNPLYSGTGVLAGSDTTCGGWLIKTSDSTTLDPVLIDSFPVTKKDGQSVIFTYHKLQAGFYSLNICLQGEQIELVSLRDQ